MSDDRERPPVGRRTLERWRRMGYLPAEPEPDWKAAIKAERRAEAEAKEDRR